MSDRSAILDTLKAANLESIEFAARAKGESGSAVTQTMVPASVVAGREASSNSPTNSTEDCISCGKEHIPVDGLYLGRDRYACSEKCWDEYVQWGRYAR